MSQVTKLLNFNEETKSLFNRSNTYCHILQMYALVMHFYAGSRLCSETHLVKLELKQTWVCLFKVAASKGLNLSVIIA